MATVRVEAVIDVPAQRVWEAIADVGAVHRRLLPFLDLIAQPCRR